MVGIFKGAATLKIPLYINSQFLKKNHDKFFATFLLNCKYVRPKFRNIYVEG